MYGVGESEHIENPERVKGSVGCFSQTQRCRSKRWGVTQSPLPPCVLSMSWKGSRSSRATGKAAEHARGKVSL